MLAGLTELMFEVLVLIQDSVIALGRDDKAKHICTLKNPNVLRALKLIKICLATTNAKEMMFFNFNLLCPDLGTLFST